MNMGDQDFEEGELFTWNNLINGVRRAFSDPLVHGSNCSMSYGGRCCSPHGL